MWYCKKSAGKYSEYCRVQTGDKWKHWQQSTEIIKLIVVLGNSDQKLYKDVCFKQTDRQTIR